MSASVPWVLSRGHRHRGLLLPPAARAVRFLSEGPGQRPGQPVAGCGPVPAGPGRIAGPFRGGRRGRVVCWKLLVHSASPLMRQSRVCPWLVLVSADGRRRGHVRDRRGDPWLTAGLRPVRFASRCCAALCGVDAVGYSVAATVLIQTRLSPSVANATGGGAAGAGGSQCQGGSRHARPVSRPGPRPGSGCGKPAKPTCAGCPDPRSVVISETHVRCPWCRYCVGTTQSARRVSSSTGQSETDTRTGVQGCPGDSNTLAASSRSRHCRYWRLRPRVRRRTRWMSRARRSRWSARRAMSGCSPTKGHRWPR
jgi:hypothetical protein